MKTNKTQRYTKQRNKKGLFVESEYSFNPLCSGLKNSQETWPVCDLYNNAAFLFENFKKNSLPLNNDYDILSWAIAVLSCSPNANTMLKEAMEEGWSVALADLDKHDFHLDVPERLITLSNNGLLSPALGRSEYFRNVLLVSFIRALRDVWQEKRHGGFDSEYGPEAVLTLERVRAADLDVMAILVGWELRSENHSDLWRYLIGSEEGDIAMRFSGHLDRDASALFTGAALISAFRQWFCSIERIDACDHEVLEYMDEIIRANSEVNPFGQKKTSPTRIEILSCLPDKTAYLRGYGQEILVDPLYSGLDDSINQSHLMHILYDLQVTYAGNVPFRDAKLAAKIFPDGDFPFIEDAFLETE